MLEHVREARLAALLVARADVIPDVHRDDGDAVVFVDEHGEAVVEYELVMLDLELRAVEGRRHELRREQEDEREFLHMPRFYAGGGIRLTQEGKRGVQQRL